MLKFLWKNLVVKLTHFRGLKSRRSFEPILEKHFLKLTHRGLKKEPTMFWWAKSCGKFREIDAFRWVISRKINRILDKSILNVEDFHFSPSPTRLRMGQDGGFNYPNFVTISSQFPSKSSIQDISHREVVPMGLEDLVLEANAVSLTHFTVEEQIALCSRNFQNVTLLKFDNFNATPVLCEIKFWRIQTVQKCHLWQF